jgi:hypothetical protein
LLTEIQESDFVALQERYFEWCQVHPEASNTEKLIALNRLYEKAHFGVTSRDLARGYEIEYFERNDGTTVRLRNDVRGRFIVGGDGNRGIGADPVCQYAWTGWKEDASMPTREVRKDKKVQREIALAASEHTTASDILTKGTALLEHEGIDTGFGATPGVISPQFVNMLLELVSGKAMFKNFVRMVPMPSMNFYFPLKQSVIKDNTNIAAATAPTAEGRAGLEYAISYGKFLVNGWKYLRHAALTVELIQMLSRFINVREDYITDMRDAMALLWDFTIAEGMYSMLTTAKWRRYDVSGAAWADSEYVPLSGASGAEILTTNHPKHLLFQDLTSGSANYGKVYEPDVDAGEALDYETSTLLPQSGTGDDLFELIVSLATKLKEKDSKIEFFMAPPKITEYFFRDSRFLDMTLNTGNPAFQTESGFLGQIAIGGSNQRVDLWEYETDVLGTKASTDTTPRTLYPVFAGAYNRFWNQGIFSPFYMRVDDGQEVKDTIGTGGSDVLRPNETRVITVGSRGSSFPGDYHHLVLGLISLNFAHA